jgi:hypothetical protein
MRMVQDVLNRLSAEYLAMPGLRLKPEQVQRLCGIERTMCQLVLDSLLESKFLCVKSDGRYARLTDGTIHRPHPAKAGIRTDTPSKKAS